MPTVEPRDLIDAPMRSLNRFRRWIGRYWIVALTLGIIVASSLALRLTLLAVFVEPDALTFGGVLRILFVGLRFDVMIGLILLVPQMLHMTFYGNRRVQGRASRLSIQVGLLITFAFMLFIGAAEFLFFEEFQSRFNYIAFEYLIYPTEVVTNIWESYPLVPILVAIAVIATALTLAVRRSVLASLKIPLPLRRRLCLQLGALAGFVALVLTTGPRSLAVTANRAANECAGNGIYSFCYYAWTNRFDYEPFYLTIDEQQAYARVRRILMDASAQPVAASDHPLDRIVTAPGPRKDLNVVLILEESLGSDFIGALGDKRGLTPCLDRLTEEGILFDRFFATGNRTARALEATLASIPPIPTESILKRDHSDHVYTLARVLQGRGYETLFVYGGRGLFDGMRSFMNHNGFDRFVEQSDYEDPTFVTAWGVCDEDIFDRAIDEFDALDHGGKQFFATVLSVSNHRPFTFPDGRIDLPSEAQRRSHAVKYSDWALGRFFDEARRRAFYDKTIFVVMGDHGARVYGAEMFPVKSYRVPVLMITPDGTGAGTRCSTLASSLDIAPTILGRLGGTYRSTFFGRDVLALERSQGYALMQHNRDLALLDDDGLLTVLGCPRTATCYRLDPKTYRLDEQPSPDPTRFDPVIALFQSTNRLYYDDRLFPGFAPVSAASSSAN